MEICLLLLARAPAEGEEVIVCLGEGVFAALTADFADIAIFAGEEMITF
jgi:hypothetical protein